MMCFFVKFQAPSPPWVMMGVVVKGDSDIWTSSRNVRSGAHGPSMGAQDWLMLMRRPGRTEMQNCPIKGKIVKYLANFHVSTCCRPAKVKGGFNATTFQMRPPRDGSCTPSSLCLIFTSLSLSFRVSVIPTLTMSFKSIRYSGPYCCLMGIRATRKWSYHSQLSAIPILISPILRTQTCAVKILTPQTLLRLLNCEDIRVMPLSLQRSLDHKLSVHPG